MSHVSIRLGSVRLASINVAEESINMRAGSWRFLLSLLIYVALMLSYFLLQESHDVNGDEYDDELEEFKKFVCTNLCDLDSYHSSENYLINYSWG